MKSWTNVRKHRGNTVFRKCYISFSEKSEYEHGVEGQCEVGHYKLFVSI